MRSFVETIYFGIINERGGGERGPDDLIHENRKLHEKFVRKNAKNFGLTGNPNVNDIKRRPPRPPLCLLEYELPPLIFLPASFFFSLTFAQGCHHTIFFFSF